MALTPAQKQKAYRDRRKKEKGGNAQSVTVFGTSVTAEHMEEARRILGEAGFYKMTKQQKFEFGAYLLPHLIDGLNTPAAAAAFFNSATGFKL